MTTTEVWCPRCLHPAHLGVCLVLIGRWSVAASSPMTPAEKCCCVCEPVVALAACAIDEDKTPTHAASADSTSRSATRTSVSEVM